MTRKLEKQKIVKKSYLFGRDDEWESKHAENVKIKNFFIKFDFDLDFD